MARHAAGRYRARLDVPWFMLIPSFALLALGAACLVYYSVVRARVARSMRTLPTLSAGVERDAPRAGWPSVCVVVPAHNEEEHIVGHAASLLAQEYPGELHIVWALDRCTDDTERLLRATIDEHLNASAVSVEVITIDACPDDWSGKVHAVHTGLTRSDHAPRADLLLFTDADTWFDPRALRAAVALRDERNVDMLSLLCTLTHDQPFELRAQPAAGFELVRRFPLDRVNDPKRGLRFANGQFMLFTREAYDAVGGHEAVKDALLEDLALARRMRHHTIDRTIGVLMADGLVRCRMYADWDEFRRGWKRIYTEAAHRDVKALTKWAWRARLLGAVLPFAPIACAGWGLAALIVSRDVPLGVSMLVVGGLGRVVYRSAMGLVYTLQHAPAWAVAWYPTGAWRVGSILLEAARDLKEGTPTTWGGRDYAREAR